jgi:hypothetical protein
MQHGRAMYAATQARSQRAEARAQAAEAERDGLRKALIESGRNAGALLADEVSSSFLQLVPEEIAALYGRRQAAEAKLEEVRVAAEPIKHYIAMREAKPLRQMDDSIHGIHIGTEWAAELKLSSLRALAAVLTEKETGQ